MQVHGKKIKTKVKRITTTLLSEILEHNLTPYIYYILTRRTRLALTLFYYYLFTIAAPMIGLHVVGIFFFVKSLHGPLLFTTSVVYHHYYPLARLVLKAPLSLLPHPSGAVTHPLQVCTPTYYSTLVYCTVDQYFSCCYGFPQFQGNYVGTPYGLLTQLGRPSARYFPASPKIVDDTLYQQRDSFVSCRVKKFGVSLLTAMSFKSCIYLNVQYSTYKPFQNCPLGCDLYGLG